MTRRFRFAPLVGTLLGLAPLGACDLFDDDPHDHHPTTATHADVTPSADADAASGDATVATDAADGDTTASGPVALVENRKRPETWLKCEHANADGSKLVTTTRDGLVILDPTTLAATPVAFEVGGPRLEIWSSPDPRWVWLMAHGPGAWRLAPLDLALAQVGPVMTLGADVRLAEDRNVVWSQSARRAIVYRADAQGRYDGLRIYALPADPASFDPSAVLAGARDLALSARPKAWARLAPDATARWLGVVTAKTSGVFDSAVDPVGYLLDLDTPGALEVALEHPPAGPVTFHPGGRFVQTASDVIDLAGAAPTAFVPPCTIIGWEGDGAICADPAVHNPNVAVTLAALDLASHAATPLAHVTPPNAGIVDYAMADPLGGRWLVLDLTHILTGYLAVVDATTFTPVSADTSSADTHELLVVPGRSDLWFRSDAKEPFRYAFGSGAATALGHDPIDGLDWAEAAQRLLVCDHDAMRVRSVDPTSGAVFATFERDPDTAPE